MCALNNKLKQGSANFFSVAADSKYFWLYEPCVLCCNYLALPGAWRKPRQYVNRWAWLCSNKTLLMKTDNGLAFAHEWIMIYWLLLTSTLAWKIPWKEEPGRLQSTRSLRVRHDWAASLSLFTFMHWRRKWQPTPVFLPGESQGRWGLVGGRLWGRTESDTTEAT